MQSPIQIIDLELSQPIAPFLALAQSPPFPDHPSLTSPDHPTYRNLWALLRWQDTPIGYIKAPLHSGELNTAHFQQSLLDQQGEALLQQLIIQTLQSGWTPHFIPAHFPPSPCPPAPLPLPKVTVIVCTRDRATQLPRCLDALIQLRYPNLEYLLIDNAPSDDRTQTLVQRYPQVRYVREPRPGLDWARNRAILEARGEILAYTDDDVQVDPNWVNAIVESFNESPAIMAVTGLVVPAELNTEAQVWFEELGGFGKGFQRRDWRFPLGQGIRWFDLGMGNLGTGANMAFRKAALQAIGGFDPALDVGTPTQGAGDLDVFFRILKAGYGFRYEPRALVRHQHRATIEQLRTQLQNNGSVYAAFVRSALAYPEHRAGLLRLGLTWLWSGNLRPWLAACCYPAQIPQQLRWSQVKGCLIGLTSYFRARRQAEAIRQQYGDLVIPAVQPTLPNPMLQGAIAVRSVDLSKPLPVCTDVAGYGRTQVIVNWQGAAIGQVVIANQYQPISARQLSEAIVQELGWLLLTLGQTGLRTQPEIAKAEALLQLEDALRQWTHRSIDACSHTAHSSGNGSTHDFADSSADGSIDDFTHDLTHGAADRSAEPFKDQQHQPQDGSVDRLPNRSTNALIEGSHYYRRDDLRSQALIDRNPDPGSDSATHPATDPGMNLDSQISVSIIIGTYDRPDDLRRCLQHLARQSTDRSIEVIVVDNHPGSGLTAPLASEFPSVRWLAEPRQGVAYARNAGILASQGEIIVTVDDDVSMPPDWLERLIAPFTRSDVLAVTGNVLPLELETEAQQLFERYGNGGLGRGYRSFEVNGDWFARSGRYAVPTWELGGTANSAYRAAIFRDPAIGLMEETLGPGMPSGVGEDIYLFYRILKAGGTIRYEATAAVWHRHRRDRSALQRQLYNYSKGFVAYHLTTLLQDHDYRALTTLLIFLPLYHLKQVWDWLTGDRSYPLALIGVESVGNLMGAWSLWRSRQRVQRWGRSLDTASGSSSVSTPWVPSAAVAETGSKTGSKTAPEASPEPVATADRPIPVFLVDRRA